MHHCQDVGWRPNEPYYLSHSRLDAMHIEVKSEVGGNQRLASNTSSCGEGGTLDGMDGTGVEPKKFWGKDHRFNTSSRRLLPV